MHTPLLLIVHVVRVRDAARVFVSVKDVEPVRELAFIPVGKCFRAEHCWIANCLKDVGIYACFCTRCRNVCLYARCTSACLCTICLCERRRSACFRNCVRACLFFAECTLLTCTVGDTKIAHLFCSKCRNARYARCTECLFIYVQHVRVFVYMRNGVRRWACCAHKI